MKKILSSCFIFTLFLLIPGTARSDGWDKIFLQSDKVTNQKVSFNNRYGINIVADIYIPSSRLHIDKLPTVVVAPPLGAAKEQAAGFYAQTLAEHGFVTLAFDPSYQGESGGNVRYLASPETYVDDIISAVDYLTTHDAVDTNNIGILGISSGAPYAFRAMTVDPRIKSIVSINLYDLGRERQRGLNNTKSRDDLQKMLQQLVAQRQSENRDKLKQLSYIVPFDVAENSSDVEKELYSYYRTARGQHPRASLAITRTSDTALIGFDAFKDIDLISPRPVLIITGEKAFSRYFSEDMFISLADPKELQIVPEANHIDLYDQEDLIPFASIDKFFKESLSVPPQE